jgi:hypothetical protein
MTTPVPPQLRQLVARRAQHLCEYCLIHEEDTFFGCEVEHVISQKHGGPTLEHNLAYACAVCNRHKGSDISSLTLGGGQLCRFFNPRTDRWPDHFNLEAVTMRSLTDIGDVTIRLLQFNHVDRILEREALQAVGRFPSAAARSVIGAPR